MSKTLWYLNQQKLSHSLPTTRWTLFDRKATGQKKVESLASYPAAIKSGDSRHKSRKADSASWSLCYSSTLPSHLSLIFSHIRQQRCEKNVFMVSRQ